MYSILTVIELRLPVSESSTRILKFYTPMILNTNVIKQELKIGYPYDSIWDCLDWEPAIISTTLCSAANGESLIYPSIKSWSNTGDISLPLNSAIVLKSHTHHPEQHQFPIQQKPTTISLIIYKHSTHTKLHHFDCSRSEGQLSNP